MQDRRIVDKCILFTLILLPDQYQTTSKYINSLKHLHPRPHHHKNHQKYPLFNPHLSLSRFVIAPFTQFLLSSTISLCFTAFPESFPPLQANCMEMRAWTGLFFPVMMNFEELQIIDQPYIVYQYLNRALLFCQGSNPFRTSYPPSQKHEFGPLSLKKEPRKALSFKVMPYRWSVYPILRALSPKTPLDTTLKTFFGLLSDKIIDYIMIKQRDSQGMSSESQQERYTPDQAICEKTKQRRRRTAKSEAREAVESVQGKWTLDENVKYVLFMDYYTSIFSSKEKRKSLRIFKSLATFLETRTARQCRSHFQKIMNKFKKLSKVKQHYQQLIGPVEYQNRLESLSELLKNSVVKVEEERVQVNYGMQTENMQIRLLDLPNEEIIRLMNLLNEYYRTQYVDWMAPQKPSLDHILFNPSKTNHNHF